MSSKLAGVAFPVPAVVVDVELLHAASVRRLKQQRQEWTFVIMSFYNSREWSPWPEQPHGKSIAHPRTLLSARCQHRMQRGLP